MSTPPAWMFDDDAPLPEPDSGERMTGAGPDDATAYTDLGNAERFVEQHGADLRYCATLGGWYAWTGDHWSKDETLTAQRLAQETARRLWVEVEAISRTLASERDEERRATLAAMLKAATAHATRSQHHSRLVAMLAEARAIPPIPVAWSDFDASPTDLLLNTPSGTVDLTTGRCVGHRRADLITKCATVPYVEGAEAPRFRAFLERILPDPEVRAYMQRFAGYAATGVIREHVFPVWYGTGANGKSTLAELMRRTLGAYAMKLPAGYFEATKYRGHETEIAQLRGARLAIASETERAAQMAEARLKDLTGGEAVRGRYMRADHFEFVPNAKYVMLTNHRPRIASTDEGILRRIVLVPFEVSIPAGERVLDLTDRILADEGPGVLRWIVEGARDLAGSGWRLMPPDSIQAATAEYLKGEDVVGRFLDEACTVRPPGDRLVKSKPGDLQASFRRWCDANGEAACDARDFADRLRRRGYEKRKSHGTWYVHGIAPLSDLDDDEERYE